MARPSLETILRDYEVNAFLVCEAELLDQRRFEKWLELFTPDAVYYVPQRYNRTFKHGTADCAIENEVFSAGVPLFNDIVATLRLRVAKLLNARSGCENPPSRTRHFFTNVSISDTEDAGTLEVKASVLVYKSRIDTEEHWVSAERTDLLRRVDGEFKIASRRIVFDTALITSGNLSIFF